MAATALFSMGCALPRMPVDVPKETTQTQVDNLHETPEMRQLVRDLSHEASVGAVDGIANDPKMPEYVHALVAQLTAELMKSFDPMMTKLGAMGPAMMSSMMSSITTELKTSLGPALRTALVEDVLRNPEVKAALQETTRDLAKQAVLGSNDGLTELKAHEHTTPLGAAAGLISSRSTLPFIVGGALLFLIPIFWLLKDRAAARRWREQAERRTTIAVALLRASNTSTSKGEPPQLHALLSQLLNDPGADGKEEIEEKIPPSHRGGGRLQNA